MSSQRLPGKVLAPLDGRPMLGLVLDRLTRARLPAAVVVTTSDGAEDDPVAELCAGRGVAVHRGSLNDVSGRLLAAAETNRLDAIVRVSGDSPFLDQALVDEAIETHRSSGAEVVTNVFPRRTFPPGESVELLTLEALRRARSIGDDPSDREHVTPPVYRHPERFAIESLTSPEDMSGVRLTVDEPAHAELAEAVLRRMERDHWEYGWREVAALVQEAA